MSSPGYLALIACDALDALMQSTKVVVLDCTFKLDAPDYGRQQYLKHHIPGAYFMDANLDLSSPVIKGSTGRHPLPHPEVFSSAMRAAGLEPGIQVVAYDQDNGMYASRAWWLLKWLGHEKVAVLNGGFHAWHSSGKATDNQWPAPKKGSFQGIPDAGLIALRDEIENGVPRLVDSRAYKRYLGEIEPIDPVAGHIRGAVCVPHMDNTTETGFWKPLDFLQEKFALLTEGDPPVFYCGSGISACHNILGFYLVTGRLARLYPGSYSEWINFHTPATGPEAG